MAEGWRRTDVEEWGNSAVIADAGGGGLEHILWTLHHDAAKTLPPGTRYDLRAINRKGQIAWYSHTLMIDDPTWGGGFGWRDGCYLIGQYLTPEKA